MLTSARTAACQLGSRVLLQGTGQWTMKYFLCLLWGCGRNASFSLKPACLFPGTCIVSLLAYWVSFNKEGRNLSGPQVKGRQVVWCNFFFFFSPPMYSWSMAETSSSLHPYNIRFQTKPWYVVFVGGEHSIILICWISWSNVFEELGFLWKFPLLLFYEQLHLTSEEHFTNISQLPWN